MSTFAEKLYRWELQRAEKARRFVSEGIQLFVFFAYFVLKWSWRIVWFFLEKPGLRRQIEPGKYEKIDYAPKIDVQF